MNPKILFLLLPAFLIVAFTACRHHLTSTPASSCDGIIELARQEIDSRKHGNALELLDSGRLKCPGRPEWAYEKGRALFFMGRFDASAEACRQALDREPDFHDARVLNWAARLEAASGSEEVKAAIRNEIEALLETGETTEPLLAAHSGFAYLKDEAAQQEIALRLAAQAGGAGKQKSGEIAARIFEQIIGAQGPSERPARLQLMSAYVFHFPENRFADYVVYRLLTEKLTDSGQVPDLIDVLKSHPAFASGSWRQKMGVARWLIEQEAMPETAVTLLRESLDAAGDALVEKPPYYTDTLWQEEREKEFDRIHCLLGRAYFIADDSRKAEAEFMNVARKNRNWGEVYHYLGMIARGRHDYETAIDWFRRALENEQRPASEAALGELLLECHGYQGDASRYFTDREEGISFSDATESAGLRGITAARIAWGDYDGDGFPDLLIDGRRLFKNRGDGVFSEMTDAAGLGSTAQANGGVWGDYDGDGAVDILLTSWSGNRLFRNRGDGTFGETTAEAFGRLEARRTEAAAWGDLDNDGNLDLYAANYERPGVMRAIGTHDNLYRNNGDGTFTDVSSDFGIQPDEAMCGRGVTWTDINGDGCQEIVVANYRLDPNFCWSQKEKGFLSDAADAHGIRGCNINGAFGHSIGPVSGDLNNDGHIDLFISNLAHPRYIEFSDQNMVLLNQGPPDYAFANRFFGSGIAFEETNSDPALADVDNDGDLDLYISSIYPGRYSHLYLNDGAGRFTDASWQTRTRVENAWGVAFADYNNDGFVDLAVASKDGVRLFRNDGNGNHWIKVNVRDSQCNRLGIGSRVTVAYAGRRQVREIAAGRGTGSQDEAAVLFGLGDYNGPIVVSTRTLCGDDLQMHLDSPDRSITLTQ